MIYNNRYYDDNDDYYSMINTPEFEMFLNYQYTIKTKIFTENSEISQKNI